RDPRPQPALGRSRLRIPRRHPLVALPHPWPRPRRSPKRPLRYRPLGTPRPRLYRPPPPPLLHPNPPCPPPPPPRPPETPPPPPAPQHRWTGPSAHPDPSPPNRPAWSRRGSARPRRWFAP